MYLIYLCFLFCLIKLAVMDSGCGCRCITDSSYFTEELYIYDDILLNKNILFNLFKK